MGMEVREAGEHPSSMVGVPGIRRTPLLRVVERRKSGTFSLPFQTVSLGEVLLDSHDTGNDLEGLADVSQDFGLSRGVEKEKMVAVLRGLGGGTDRQLG